MKNEEILKAVQEKQNTTNEYEKHTFLLGTDLTNIICSILCIILVIAQYVLKQTYNYGVVSIMFAINSTQYCYRGIKLHKNLSLTFGILCVILTVFFVLIFFGEMVKS